MKHILTALFFFVATVAFGQTDVNRTNPVSNNPAASNYNKSTVNDANLRARLTLYIPKGATPTLNNAKDSTGAVYFATADSSFNIRLNGSWIKYQTYAAAKKYADSVANTILPIGLQGQIMKAIADNSNSYATYDALMLGNYITTQAELDSAKNHYVPQSVIFNSWKRYAVGGNPAIPQSSLIDGKIPQIATQTNSWEYDSVNDVVKSTFNTGSHIGFVSKRYLENYTHRATLYVSPGAGQIDNDQIGLVISFVEDANDQVTNQAFGLNPADFQWPIDVTSPTIANQHSLVVLRSRSNVNSQYVCQYDKNNLGAYTVVANTSPWTTLANWVEGVEVDIEVVREGDIITIRTSDFSDAPGGKGALRFPITIDLNSDPRLAKFKGAARYGYMALSQAGASYKNIFIDDGINDIYDLRNGNVWVADNAGDYAIDTDRNVFAETPPRSFLFNETTKKLLWLKEDDSYTLLNGLDSAASGVVPTIAALQAYTENLETLIVQDSLRGGIFNYVASGTADNGITFAATGKGSGYWVRQFTGPVYGEWFDAKGNGIADDTQPLQKGMSASSNFALRTKTYKVSQLLIPPYADYTFNGNGATLNNSAATGTVSVIKTDTIGKYVYLPITVTAPIARNATAITVSSASGISKGDILNLRTNESVGTSGDLTYKKGEIVTVFSVSGTTVNLSEPLAYNMIPDSIKVYKINPTKLKLSNVNIIMNNGLDTAMNLYYLNNSHIDRINMKSLTTAAEGVKVTYSTNVEVSNIYGGGFSNPNTAYGVNVSGNNMLVRNSNISNARHAFTSAARAYISRNITFRDVIASKTTLAAIDFHANVINGMIDHATVTNSVQGAALRGDSIMTVQNSVFDDIVQQAIGFDPEIDGLQNLVTLKNNKYNRVNNSTTRGVINITGLGITNANFSDDVYTDCEGYAIYVPTGATLTNSTIDNNRFYRQGASPMLLKGGNNIISNNSIYSFGVITSTSRGIWLNSGGDGNTFKGNTIIKSGTGATYGISIEGTNSTTVVTGNTVPSFTSANGIRDIGSGTNNLIYSNIEAPGLVFNKSLTASTLLALNADKVAVSAVAGTDYLAPSAVNGTAGYVAKFASTNAIVNSLIYDSGTAIGIGTGTAPEAILHSKATSFATATMIERTGNATNAMVQTQRVVSTTTADMVDGFGAGIYFGLRDNAGATINNVGTIGMVRAGADNTGDYVVLPSTAGVNNERMRVTAAGAWRMNVTPTTSAGTYDVLTRNTSTGNIEKISSTAATLDFPSTLAQASSELTITVTGAADGDVVSLGVPNASSNANSCFTARVSTANTVTVKFNNYSAAPIDPTTGTFKVIVFK